MDMNTTKARYFTTCEITILPARVQIPILLAKAIAAYVNSLNSCLKVV